MLCLCPTDTVKAQYPRSGGSPGSVDKMSPCPGPSAICRGYSRSADLSFQNYPIKIYQQAWRYFFPQLISTIQRVDEGEGPRWRSAWREVNGSADEDAIFRSPDLWTSRYLRERAAASQAAP